jgi:hypothetical protein
VKTLRGKVNATPSHPLGQALLICCPHLTRAPQTVIVDAQFRESGMKVNLVAPSLEYGTAQVVMQNDPRCAGRALKGMNVAA